MKNKEIVEAGNRDVVETTSDNGKGQHRKERASYPKFTLDEALDIARAIKESYAGKPMPPSTLAEACGSTSGSTPWRIKLAASVQYGLTEGSYGAKTISLMPRAVSILSPRSPEEKLGAMSEAAMEPEAMGVVYRHFDNGAIPRGDFFLNTLQRDFGIPADQCERFDTILRANAMHAYSRVETDLGDCLEIADLSIARADEDTADLARGEAVRESLVLAQPDIVRQASAIPVRVFISHSDDEDMLDVLRTTMEIAGFEYEIAEDEETTAYPVPDKVMDAMRRCSAAIINVSMDEREKRADGTYGVNQNVLIEVGCAFALYGQRKCILLWDRSVEVPSNLQGLYRCEYTDSLSASDLLKLQRATADFRKGG